MKKRNRSIMVLITFATFGLYYIYWSSMIQKDLRKYDGEGPGFFGHWFMTIFSFLIYLAWWDFQGRAYRRLESICGENIDQKLVEWHYGPGIYRAPHGIPYIMQELINLTSDEKLAALNK